LPTYTPYELAGLLVPYDERPHLWAVMNDACKDGLCMLVMISSIKAGRSYDNTCVLQQGDHPFIDHDSYVVYRLAYTSRADHIGNMVDKKIYIPKEDWDVHVFNRIAAGIYQSDQISRGMEKYAVANNI
jgi:hypothetical protein